MADKRFRIEYWHLDEVSVLDYSTDVTASRYLALLREAHASGVVVVVAEESSKIVGWYPLWPAGDEAAGRPVDAYLAEVVRQVRAGALDAALVYRKNLRKDAGEYTASTPPHVAAARKSTRPRGRLVSYVMTTDGPEPLDNRRHPLDREHYVTKQIRPVAEPVLETLGLDFERVIGDSRQRDLF